MPNQLPPLTALRAFDAAARHMSFAQAALELNVTPAALSFQIKSLEEHLGAPLFRRLNRAVELTEAGQALAPGAAEGFQTLATAWHAAKRTQDKQTLTVTAGPAFTAKWLAPRLFEFAQAHPEIELRFAASLQLMDLKRDNVDVAIRFGRDTPDDVYALPLAHEWIMPVMTPVMAKQFPTVESLHHAPIIFDDSITFLGPSLGWSAWFEAMGSPFSPTQGPRFSQADHALDAGLAGAGVVLGRRAMVVKDLDEGRLVAPFPVALSINAGFSFLCLKGMETRPQIAAFKDWILDEIEKVAHITENLTILQVPEK
ncbi:transcriptional regulator GcvA [Sulfitobacter donghicola]|uniref:Transcriptional regulator n=1 Tax=Sulfitobacter donghicola DSW-25 = KCTC 12864 = JCM 14565 TaxID=1300350 RepID=A0A073IEK7_9RHOB|nr:transcriptional regulator GcvA [Sulfitobacter donghicola]KEJ88793.1 transcriptional regulator [Sulfitobacter donghicola DSW-25 = KCTC 12864 = JCM 14565]KIN68585.1 HTH-type transcriptional regulator, LysR family [Sulfitobacter donghicola DSW-25 = KCTC 12864 = JCM 14565]